MADFEQQIVQLALGDPHEHQLFNKLN